MTSDIHALTPTYDYGAAPAAGSAAGGQSNLATDALAQKETFLRLLVAQIRNQNPLDPADGIEFLAQLAQFSQLEQMLEIRAELETIRKNLTAAPGENPSPAGGG